MEKIKPVFEDIYTDTFNPYPEKVEAVIIQQTTAIMPRNVYGNPYKLYGFQKNY